MGVAMTYTDDDTECRLIGGVFSICVQIILASVCVSTLIVKRMFEIPQREWTVWFFDFMKQGKATISNFIDNFTNAFSRRAGLLLWSYNKYHYQLPHCPYTRRD